MKKINWLRISLFVLLLIGVTYLFFQLDDKQSLFHDYSWFSIYIVYIFTNILGGMLGFGVGLIIEMLVLYGIAALLEKIISRIFSLRRMGR